MKRSLLNALSKGGFIFYVRHGEANVGEDLPWLNFQNCLTQRRLSEKGRWQAKCYGEMLRYLQIPIQPPVSASPFCRTIETAQLAFGWDNVQVNPFWFEIYRLSENFPSDIQSILTNLNSIFETIPTEGKNKIIVAHSFPKGVGLGEIPYMGTIIIKPKGEGNGFEVIDQISLEDWNILNN